jgi:ribosomal protein S12 methylthiotransferase
LIKFFIDQHGCAKNQVDGELLIGRLCSKGFVETFDPCDAQLIIINSCGFIESAKKESLEAVYTARKQYPEAKILLAGCLAERYADIFKTELPEADGIFGNGDLSRLDDTIDKLLAGGRPVVVPPQTGVCGGDRNMLLSFRGSVYVKITEGCNNHCTFCAIPLIRGNLRSRTAAEIGDEIKKLLTQGMFEINLIGQDLAAYGSGAGDNVFGEGPEPLASIDASGTFTGTQKESALARLLKQISALSGNFRIRLLYIHPDHFNRDILSVMRTDHRLLPYFDIPFQSGDDAVIHAMNRRGNAALYIRLVEDIRRAFPDAAIRTTFLTGFPGETEEAFTHTCEFLSAIGSDWSGCFPYSREEDTPGYLLKHQVPKKISQARASTLSSMQTDITRRKLLLRLKSDYDVLVEEVIAGNEGLAIGRAWFQAPEVDGSVVIRYDRENPVEMDAVKTGRIVRVHPVASSDVDIDAVFVADSPLNQGIPAMTVKFAVEEKSVSDNA